LDVVVGLNDLERIGKLVRGRNRSVPVKEWSLKDFKGEFDWLKAHIDRTGGPFRGKIGWEENAGTEVSVLDLIGVMTLFHPSYHNQGGRRSAPTVAFSSKGTGDQRLIDEEMAPGYQSLRPVLEDVLYLHDYVYANFEPTYERYNKSVHNKGSKLGKRRGFECRAIILPFTGTQSEYRVDKGMLYPLLAAHRALLRFPSSGAKWRTDPRQLFDDHGPDLVRKMFDQYENLNNNPAAVGKNRAVYESL
jgi:hypothetical protein